MTEASDLAHQAGFPNTVTWIAYLARKNAHLTRENQRLEAEVAHLNTLIDAAHDQLTQEKP